jgi:hypothetical protein
MMAVTVTISNSRKRRRRIYSGTPSRLMREARIRASGSPQLQAALAAGEITLYRAGEIARLPAREQKIALAQWVSRSLLRTQGQAIAARVIREALRSSKVDLSVIVSAIRDAIAKCSKGRP